MNRWQLPNPQVHIAIVKDTANPNLICPDCDTQAGNATHMTQEFLIGCSDYDNLLFHEDRRIFSQRAFIGPWT